MEEKQEPFRATLTTLTAKPLITTRLQVAEYLNCRPV